MSEIVRSAARVLDLLEYFAANPGSVSLAEVSGAFAMPKSSALGLLRTLCSRGYVLRDEQGQYALNEVFRAQGFGWGGSPLARLMAMAHPMMQALTAEVGETTCFGALADTGQVRLLMECLSPNPLRYEMTVGRLIPLHCTAMGRMFLSAMSRPEREALLALHPIRAMTPFTITDLPGLHAEMDRARDQGYCVVIEEHERGGTGISAPVRDAQGTAVGIVNVACVSVRYQDKQKEITRALYDTVSELERRFQLPV